jgi:hypothetical protein
MVKEEKIRNAVILSAMGSDAATCVVARTRFPLHSAAFGGIDVSRGDYRKEFNARQINITPAGATELTGKHLHVTTGAACNRTSSALSPPLLPTSRRPSFLCCLLRPTPTSRGIAPLKL